MAQTKRQALIEVLTVRVITMFVTTLMQIFIFNTYFNLHLSLYSSIWLTLVFSTASTIIGYIGRRYFEFKHKEVVT